MLLKARRGQHFYSRKNTADANPFARANKLAFPEQSHLARVPRDIRGEKKALEPSLSRLCISPCFPGRPLRILCLCPLTYFPRSPLAAGSLRLATWPHFSLFLKKSSIAKKCRVAGRGGRYRRRDFMVFWCSFPPTGALLFTASAPIRPFSSHFLPTCSDPSLGACCRCRSQGRVALKASSGRAILLTEQPKTLRLKLR